MDNIAPLFCRCRGLMELLLLPLIALAISVMVVFGRPPGLVSKSHIDQCLEGESGAYFYTETWSVCCSCKAGEHWTADCKENKPNTTQCEICIHNSTVNTFTSEANSYPKCNISKSESFCKQLMYTEFHIGSMTMDNKCLCVSGSYATDPEISGCKLYTECPPDFEPKVDGDSTRDVECGPCLSGMCSYESSSTEKCVPCTDNIMDVTSTTVAYEKPSAVGDPSNQTAIAIGISVAVGAVAILILLVTVIFKCRNGRYPLQQKMKDHPDVKYKAAKPKPDHANGAHAMNGHERHDSGDNQDQDAPEDTADSGSNETVGNNDKQPKNVDLPDQSPKTSDKENPSSKYFIETEEDENIRSKKTTCQEILERPRVLLAQGLERQQLDQNTSETDNLPPTPSREEESLPRASPDVSADDSESPPSSHSGSEEELSERERQFQEELNVFQEADKVKLRQMNDPDALHDALYSTECLRYMCAQWPAKITTPNLRTFLRMNQLVGDVEISDIELAKSDPKEIRYALLKRMQHKHGNNLPPRKLLEITLNCGSLQYYDDLCNFFLKHLEKITQSKPST